MPKFLPVLLYFVCTCIPIYGQQLTVLHQMRFGYVNTFYGPGGTTDCWGWEAPDGTEYAIVGNHNSLAFVRASDGLLCDSVRAPNFNDPDYHRDMVTFRNYAYCVSEMTGPRSGVMIMDLSGLPDSVRYVRSWTKGGYLSTSHNMEVDTTTGHLYIEQRFPQGVSIVDVNDPENPKEVGFVSGYGMHDMHTQRDTLWTAQGYDQKFEMYDVTDKSNPVFLGRIADSTFGYCHNIWPSEDGKYVVTTEETPFQTVKWWDVSDPGNIQLTGQYLGKNNFAHNVHLVGSYAFISHYSAGVTVVDWSDPTNPIEVAAFDTYPQNDTLDYFGCWGVFPHTRTGKVYASNTDGYFYILQWNPNPVHLDEPNQMAAGIPYPTVFDRVVNIPLTSYGEHSIVIRVYDSAGSLIAQPLSGRLHPGRTTYAWHPQATLARGTYLLEIVQGEQRSVHRIVKQ